MSDQSDQTPANQPDPEPIKINVDSPTADNAAPVTPAAPDTPAEPVTIKPSEPIKVDAEPASELKPETETKPAEPIKIDVSDKPAEPVVATAAPGPATEPTPEPAKAPEPSEAVKAELQKMMDEKPTENGSSFVDVKNDGGDKPADVPSAATESPTVTPVADAAKPAAEDKDQPVSVDPIPAATAPQPVAHHPGSGKLIVVVILVLILAVSGIFLGWKTLSKAKKTPAPPAAPTVEAPKFDDLKAQLTTISGGQKAELAITTPAEWQGKASATCTATYNDTVKMNCAELTFTKNDIHTNQIRLYDVTDWLKVDAKCASKSTQCLDPDGLQSTPDTKKSKQDRLNFLLGLTKDTKLATTDVAKTFGPNDSKYGSIQKIAYFETADGFKGITFLTSSIGQGPVYEPTAVFYAAKQASPATLVSYGYLSLHDKASTDYANLPVTADNLAKINATIKDFDAGKFNQDTLDLYQKVQDALKTLKITITK